MFTAFFAYVDLVPHQYAARLCVKYGKSVTVLRQLGYGLKR